MAEKVGYFKPDIDYVTSLGDLSGYDIPSISAWESLKGLYWGYGTSPNPTAEFNHPTFYTKTASGRTAKRAQTEQKLMEQDILGPGGLDWSTPTRGEVTGYDPFDLPGTFSAELESILQGASDLKSELKDPTIGIFAQYGADKLEPLIFEKAESGTKAMELADIRDREIRDIRDALNRDIPGLIEPGAGIARDYETAAAGTGMAYHGPTEEARGSAVGEIKGNVAAAEWAASKDVESRELDYKKGIEDLIKEFNQELLPAYKSEIRDVGSGVRGLSTGLTSELETGESLWSSNAGPHRTEFGKWYAGGSILDFLHNLDIGYFSTLREDPGYYSDPLEELIG